MQKLPIIMMFCVLFVLFGCPGCTNHSAIGGKVVNSLPFLNEAEESFHYPFDETNDHKNCTFSEDDM